MRRLLATSALFALVLLTTTVVGQPPPGDPKPKEPGDKKPLGDKVNPKPANPTDAAIAAALANDPDVRMAKAKIQLAEAELSKARQVVTLKVVAIKAKIDQLEAEVRGLEERVQQLDRAVKMGTIPQSEFLTERAKLEAMKSALAFAQTEWKLLTGGGDRITAGSDPLDPNQFAVEMGLKWLADNTNNSNHDQRADFLRYLAAIDGTRERNVIKGPIPERIRAALDKPVKLGAKGEKFTFEKALEVFKKEVGLDVSVRGTFPVRSIADPASPNGFKNVPVEIVSEGEELPVGAWFQLFEDTLPIGAGVYVKYRFYVRDYGLLIAPPGTAPPDAPSLTEFWKQKPPAKGMKEESVPK
jgi:hypothetical protein